MKIIQFISSNSQFSRRKAEELVKSGKVKINDKVASYLDKVSDQDSVFINGKKITKAENKTFLVYKPVGYLSTTSDPENRKTVVDLVPKQNVRLYPVGRLDKDSKGLMILTNDGELANKYTHPKFEVSKTYKVTIDKNFTDKDIQRLKSGIRLKEGLSKADEVKILDQAKKTLEITLHEGKNREIRRVLGKLGYTVRELERISMGDYSLDDLEGQEWKEI